MRLLTWSSAAAISFGPASAQPWDLDLTPMRHRLAFFAGDAEGHALGAGDNTLYRIVDAGADIEAIHTFPALINAIHVTRDGLLVVATDDDWWDLDRPCRVYRSRDRGATFDQVKTIFGGSALWWSLASDRAGNLYLGEYGPRGTGQSKRLWRTADGGDTWTTVFRALDVEGVHVHRVAVDPYTDDVWVTQGDGQHASTFVSRDQGATWTKERSSQATAVAFTENAIYWGEDDHRGLVTGYDRRTQVYRTVLDASARGNYGGSVYDMAVGRTGLVYVPMVKYAGQTFLPGLWVGSGDQWQLLLSTPVAADRFGGFRHISPPDRDGYLYVEGYRIADLPPRPADIPTAVAVSEGLVSARDQLDPGFPNPFNTETTIPYELARRERVRLAIYNLKGQLVRSLVDAEQPAGQHRVTWDGADQSGAPLASAVYLCSLRTDTVRQIRHLVRLK